MFIGLTMQKYNKFLTCASFWAKNFCFHSK